MPLTAASETLRSTFLAVSLAVSMADLRTEGVVERRRVRAIGAARVVVRRRKDIFSLFWFLFGWCKVKFRYVSVG